MYQDQTVPFHVRLPYQVITRRSALQQVPKVDVSERTTKRVQFASVSILNEGTALLAQQANALRYAIHLCKSKSELGRHSQRLQLMVSLQTGDESKSTTQHRNTFTK